MDARPVDPHQTSPPSQQLAEQVLDALACGDLDEGERLPSVRAMAVMALVNPNTVGKAYRELEQLGVVRGRNGSGVYVTPDGPAIAGRLRRASTCEAFRQAARDALSAGYSKRELRELLGEVKR